MKIKVKILKSGCLLGGKPFCVGTTDEIDTKDGKLPPLWKGKAVIVQNDKKDKVK